LSTFIQRIKYPSNSIPIYIFSIFLFVIKNKGQFLSNSQVHIINPRQPSNLYLPATHLAVHQKCVHYSGIKIYNHLTTVIKDLSGDKNILKLALKRYLLHNSFYSLEEYFNTQLTMILILFRLLFMLILIIGYYNKAQLRLNVHLLHLLCYIYT